MKLLNNFSKRLSALILLIFALILTGCTTKKATISVNGYNGLRDSVVVIVQIDEDSVDVDSLTVTLTKRNDKNVQKQESCDTTDYEEQTVTFTGLEEETAYIISVKYTINKKTREIFNKVVETSALGGSFDTAKEISSSQQFIDEIKTDTDGYFKLTSDLDFKDIKFDMLHTSSKPFNGYIDGNGHTLKNISYETTSAPAYNGIFAYNTGTIKNLNIDTVTFTISRSSTLYAGVVAGYNEGTINNVTITNSTIKASSKSTGVGEFYVGLGIGHNSSKGYLDTVKVNGNLDVTVNQNVYAGGLIGLDSSFSSGRVISNSEANVVMNIKLTSIVTSAKEIKTYVGGFVGSILYSVIENSKSNSTINIEAQSKSTQENFKFELHVGGFAGFIQNTSLTNVTVSGSLDIKNKIEDGMKYLTKVVAGTISGYVSANASFTNVISNVSSIKIDVTNDCDVVANMGSKFFGEMAENTNYVINADTECDFVINKTA